MGRVRIFAGPNGSGKSTIIKDFQYNLGHYLNADDISKELQLMNKPVFNFAKYGLCISNNEFPNFLKGHTLFHRLENSSEKRAR